MNKLQRPTIETLKNMGDFSVAHNWNLECYCPQLSDPKAAAEDLNFRAQSISTFFKGNTVSHHIKFIETVDYKTYQYLVALWKHQTDAKINLQMLDRQDNITFIEEINLIDFDMELSRHLGNGSPNSEITTYTVILTSKNKR